MDQSPDLESAHDTDLCRRCQRRGVVFLKSMTKWSPLDWFRCDRCGHIFTEERRGTDDAYRSAMRRRDRRLTVSFAESPRA